MFTRSLRSILASSRLSLPAGVCVGAALLAPLGALAQPAPKVESIGDVKSMLGATLPADAMEIPDAIKGAKVGDTVTLRGWIPRTPDAFGADAAEFVLSSSTQAGVAPDAPKPPTVAVRVANARGESVKGTLRGKHALKAGAEVFVTGVVESVGPDRIAVRAAAMHVPRSPLPEGFFAGAPIDNGVDISEARKVRMRVGDEVVLRGRVGGSKSPFVAGRAVFTLVGRGLKACNEIPGDKCSMPWDYCCDTREEILANSVTVQVSDDDAQVLRTDMKGRRGLKELTEVVIVGKVATADAKSVVVNATRMYVVP